jgi:tetratricopeptide (TPR) repeat protein
MFLRPVALVLPAALLLAALLACACAPVAAQNQPGPQQAAQHEQSESAKTRPPARSSRLALAAFHLRDERGGGPAEALKVLDEPQETGGPAEQSRAGELAPADADKLAQVDSGELALRALALSQLGRYAEAVAALDALMLARRDMPPAALADAFVERGLALAALGHQARAAEDYAAALTLAPRHIPALLARADQLFALGQPGEAEAGYSRVIELAPQNVLARINRGVTRDEQGRFAEAIDDFTRAIALDPHSPVALLNRGVARSQSGDLPGMCADYEAACRLGACGRLSSARSMGFCRAER